MPCRRSRSATPLYHAPAVATHRYRRPRRDHLSGGSRGGVVPTVGDLSILARSTVRGAPTVSRSLAPRPILCSGGARPAHTLGGWATDTPMPGADRRYPGVNSEVRRPQSATTARAGRGCKVATRWPTSVGVAATPGARSPCGRSGAARGRLRGTGDVALRRRCCPGAEPDRP